MADSDSRDRREVDVPGTARAWILGINLWVVAVLLPAAFTSPEADPRLALGLIPLALLISGVLGSRRDAAKGRWLLLFAYPIAIGAAVAWLPGSTGVDPYSSAGVAVAVMSLLLFLGAANELVDDSHRIEPGRVRDLAASKGPRPTDRHRRLTARLLIASGLGALGLATLAPSRDASRWAATWGDAAPEARVLAAVLAGALACAAIVVFVGPATRVRRGASPSRAQSDRRAMLFTALAAFASAGWILLERLG